MTDERPIPPEDPGTPPAAFPMRDPADPAIDPERAESSLPSGELDLFGKPPPRGKQDWSHRKAEPRALALAWTSFLLVGTVSSFVRSGVGGVITTDGYRPAARDLMLIVMIGATLLWPLLRLSQAATRRPLIATIRDYTVIVIPAQAILWPLALLARWPLSTVAASVLLMMAFCALAGAAMSAPFMIARSRSPEDSPGAVSRLWWSAVVLLVSLAGPLVLGVALLTGGADMRDATSVRFDYMLSPLTAVFELMRDRSWSGYPVRVEAGHWAAIGVVWMVALAAWAPLVSLARGVARSRRSA
ncbi:MAG: hypothetical protein AAGG07_11960 [Planctomycetota bacterium]